MESSQFINQTRLSKKQLQLHVQQQNQNKYFLDSPVHHHHDNNYTQQQPRCQYITKKSPSSPPIPHFPAPPDYPPNQTIIFDQPSPSHRMPPLRGGGGGVKSLKKFHQSDPNSIEVCGIDYENQQHNNVGVGNGKPSIKWNRNNIAATMEKYEPTVKHNHSPNHRGHVHHGNKLTPHDNYLNEIHHMDYAYAYYEPGVPMRHQNIPDYYEEAGPSRPPPPNSIRALLSTARRNNMQRTSGKYSTNPTNNNINPQHQVGTTRSQENVYEEIHDGEKRRMQTGNSIMSLNQSMVEEEFRRVHNRHQRVLGELNLDVEEMLMPAAPPAALPNATTSTTTTTTTSSGNSFIAATPMLDNSDPLDFLGNGEVNDGLLNGAGNYNMDLDSGFSGSNSSYIGSLRYQKTTAVSGTNSKKTPLHSQLPINHQHTDSGSSFYGGSSGSATEATDEIGMISLCRSSSSLYEKSGGKKSSSSTKSNNKQQMRHGTSTSVDKSDRVSSFWQKAKSRGWMNKLPGFSSTSSINKIGAASKKTPKEVRIDCSSMLMTAVSCVYNGCDTGQYLQKCYEGVKNNRLDIKTIIRLDKSHVSNIFSHWKVWNNSSCGRVVKYFYVNVLKALIWEIEFKKVQTIAAHIIYVALSKKLGSSEKQSLKCLNAYVNGFKSLEDIEKCESEKEFEEEDDCDIPGNYWIHDLFSKIENELSEKQEEEISVLNPYFCPKFKNDLIRIFKLVPMWTNILKPFVNYDYDDVCTTGATESQFNIIKNNITRNHRLPMKSHKFLPIFIEHAKAQMIILKNPPIKPQKVEKVQETTSEEIIVQLNPSYEQKPISWEDPLPRSNSISNANGFNPQSVTRKSSNSIITFPQRHHQHSYNLNSVNNNHDQETSFYSQQQILNLNSLLNNNHLTSSPINHSQHLLNSGGGGGVKTHKKLEHTPSARSNVSSEESWCPSEDHDADDISSYNDDDDNLSDRSTSLISTRTSQLRLTFNKAKQHLSLDKWRNSSSNIMPSSTNQNQESPGEPMSRLTRWWSMRRGSNQYDLNSSNSPNRSGSIEKDGDDRSTLSNGRKMPLLQETEEDHSQTDGASVARIERRTTPLVMPPAPTNLTPSQLKRRHIISAIVHSENSYVLSLERLVKDYKRPLEESSPPILNNSKTSILFHRVPDILHCHLLLRIALNDCIRNWDRDEKIGDVFISFITQGKGAFSKTHVLDVYSGFINNFSNAMDLAKVETKRKSAFADFLNVKQISAHDRLSFFGLMVKPVQRFPQFILFLQDLLKHTPQGHHDRMSLQMALTQLESLADSLNERKREAEQYQAYKEMLSQISGTFNTRFLSSQSGSDQRNNYLLREDNVTQLEFGQNGMLVKTKARRLLLANDKVICVSVAPKQEFGVSEKFSLKWMYHISDVQIVDSQASATLSRYITSGLNRGGSLKSNHSSGSGGNDSSVTSSQFAAAAAAAASQFSNGADLANEMSVLMHDYNLMSRVHDLIGQLKGEYEDINTSLTKNVLNTIQSSIRKKDEEMAWVDSCCLQLIIKQKSGKEETLTFRTNDPSVKKEWITELRLAQLALDCNNSPAWEQSDRDNHRPLTKMPLFVKMHPVHRSTQHQTEVRCGCYYAMSPELKFHKRNNGGSSSTKNRYYLWICSVDGSSSHLTILMHQPHQSQAMIKDVTAFSLNDTVITAIDYVRGSVDGETGGDGDCVWLGTTNKKIIIYGGNNPEQEKQIMQISVPDMPTQILYHVSGDKTFVALANGEILLYRKEGDVWNLKNFHVIKLEDAKTITSMQAINSNVYVACGRRIYVLNGSTGEIQKNFEIQQASNDVNLMAHAGVGLWISLKNSPIICLYHMETFKHLQDINIAHNILRVTSKSETPSNNSLSTVYVTALMACKGLLWVGTNVGFTLTVPLPRLEGLPIISGNINISYHAHLGPVTFFLPLITKSSAAAAASQVSQITNAIESSADKKEEQEVKLEKQKSLDVQVTPTKLKHLPNSPIVLRRKSNIRDCDISRMSKTLPRGFSGIGSFLNGTSTSMRSSSSSGSSANGSDSGCDVYGLYSDLLFVKEDFDGQMTLTPMTAMSLHHDHDGLRRGNSDPDLAAIPSKVSTLDRRLRMKTGRPRSLDLSNWSVDSRSSSLFSSSGSEESMGVKYRSVSRNSSNASASQKFNGSELVNINECESTSTPAKPSTDEVAKEQVQPQFSNATMKTKRKNLKNNHHQQMVDGRRTVLTLMGGRGYVNWRHIWHGSPNGCSNSNHSSSANGEAKQHLRSNSVTMPKSQYSTEGHIIIWEKKL